MIRHARFVSYDLLEAVGMVHSRNIVRKRGHFIHLAAGPTIVRMIMALGTSDARAGEDPQRVGHVVEWHRTVAEVIPYSPVATLPTAARCSDQFAYKLVVGLV